MTRFSDAALLKGDYATMLHNPPKEADWNKTACDNGAEAAAQSIAKQIFAMQEVLDPKTERLEVVTLAAIGPIKVLGVMPIDGDIMSINGVSPSDGSPVMIMQHVTQLSLTFKKVSVEPENDAESQEDASMKIGFVIFDELKERKKSREAAKGKKTSRKTPARKATKKAAAKK